MTDPHIVHLHNRIGFGLSPAELRAARGRDRAELIDTLLRIPEVPGPANPPIQQPKNPKTNPDEAREADRRALDTLRADWMRRMADPAHPDGLERMCLFWHGHFACRAVKSELAARYLDVLRRHALGNFRELLQAVARDAAMMRYLNAVNIRRAAPNENFAREVLELFTVGVDAYTEADVRDLARALAGWALDEQERFRLNERQVDPGVKSVLGVTGPLTGAEALDVLVDDPATAAYLTRELWRYLTDREPDASTLRRHAATLRDGDYAIRPWVAGILADDAFYADELIGSRVKGPVELLAMWARQLGTALPRRDDGFVAFASANDQRLFGPPNVAGWPGGRAWLSTATLPARMAMASISATPAALPAKPARGADRSFAGVAGFAAPAVAALAGDPDLSLVLLGRPDLPGDAVALASHTRYQYA